MQDESHPDRVPGAEDAHAADAKFTEYLLSESHTQGRSKAKFFRKAGYDESNWQELRDGMLSELPLVRGEHSRSGYGGAENYEAVLRLNAPSGTIDVKTYWEVHPRTGTSFVTAYQVDSKDRDDLSST